MISKEQADKLKEQILNQIDSTFPEDSKNDAKQKVSSMTNEELEGFIAQNQAAAKDQGQCIFCSIIEGKVSTHKIDENEEAIAVLELNPISMGHTLIIPKQHFSKSEDISQNILQFAQKLSEKIKNSLSPKEVKVNNSNLFGHEIINILPIYDNENFDSERKQANKEELESLQKELTKKVEEKPKKEIKEEKKKPITNMKLPKRIP
jgi:histidine triad (HIT) family protein